MVIEFLEKNMGINTLALILLLCIINVFGYCGSSRIYPRGDDLEIKARLEALNKHPVKTFERHGIIMDCVDFYKQPAFDNPLLKNHSIQKNPSKAFKISEPSRRPEAERNRLEECPEGTVPIRRITNADLSQEKSLQRIQLDSVDPSDFANPESHRAILYRSGGKFLGAKARVGIHSPQCTGNQLTGSYVAIVDNNYDSKNNMFAGWVKSSQLYGDERSHLSIFWSNKDHGKGCFDVFCPGFVQVDRTVAPGNYFERVSVFDGDESEVGIEILQDPQTKNWWFLKSEVNVGYWPKELFSNLNQGAGAIFYGGVAIADENTESPQMGFGSYPNDLLSEAGYMARMEFTDGLGNSYLPTGSSTIETSHCYKLQDEGFDEDVGYTIIFGGPGGANCING